MPTHIDIPTLREMERLVARRAPGSVTIYLPTGASRHDSEAERIELSNLVAEALEQLSSTELSRSARSAIEMSLGDLITDDDFWRYQARTLALFVDENGLVSYRLPNRLPRALEVSDRFFIKPLLRTFTFPQAAFILAISLNAVHLIEASPDLPPDRIDVPDLPADVASAVGKSSIGDRSHFRRVGGSEGQKLRMRQYARQINRALALVLGGHDLPLVLAGTDPIVSIYRSVNSYPHLTEEAISGNPDSKSDAELAREVRPILDRLYADELGDLHDLFGVRLAQGRATTDLAEVARASTIGAVDTLLVDIEQSVHGDIDEDTGQLNSDSRPSAKTYGVTDEIARRVLMSSGRVLAVRGDEVPGNRGSRRAASLPFDMIPQPNLNPAGAPGSGSEAEFRAGRSLGTNPGPTHRPGSQWHSTLPRPTCRLRKQDLRPRSAVSLSHRPRCHAQVLSPSFQLTQGIQLIEADRSVAG